MNRIVFLGSAGGGLMLATQTRKTGGLYLEFGPDNDVFAFGLDPGPGALVHAAALGLNPGKWRGLLVSHHHIDAANDVNAILDSMRETDPKQKDYPFLIAEEHCLKQTKKDDPYPYITKFHQNTVKKMFSVSANSSIKIEKLEVMTTKALHYTHTVGFRIKYNTFEIGYPADGSYYSGQEKSYEGCDVLVLNVPWPKGHDAPRNIHMNLDEAITFVKSMKEKPKLVVLSHLSPYMLRANLFKQEKIFQDATSVRCISASDFMELDLDTLKTRILKPVVRI